MLLVNRHFLTRREHVDTSYDNFHPRLQAARYNHVITVRRCDANGL